MEPGGLVGYGNVASYFRFEYIKGLFWGRAHVALEAFLCLDCGNVDIFGDLKKAQALANRD
jgi:hypothetical protein